MSACSTVIRWHGCKAEAKRLVTLEKLFILAGMPATGKSTLGRQRTPLANWPLDDWWQESIMACDLPKREFADFPQRLAVEIAFSHIGPDGKPQLGAKGNPLETANLKRLCPPYTAIVTLWVPTSVLLERFTGRKANHPKKREVEELYNDPRRLIEFYRAWLECVDAFPHDEHWVLDTSDGEFRRPAWLTASCWIEH